MYSVCLTWDNPGATGAPLALTEPRRIKDGLWVAQYSDGTASAASDDAAAEVNPGTPGNAQKNR